ncbi:MAG: hypothetical protein PVH00_08910 [Gemmatimonadota bacterium]
MSPVAFALAGTVVSASSGSGDWSRIPEPQLAIRLGVECSQCHINRTGGGGRNDFGSLFGQTQLGLRPSPALRSRSAEQWLTVGGDLRVLASGVFRDATPRNSVSIEEANIKATWGYLDRDRSIDENARVRGRFGVELYPVGALRLSAFYLLLEDVPQATTDLDRWNLEMYVFF